MKQLSSKTLSALILLPLMLLIASMLSLSIGEVEIPFGNILDTFNNPDSMEYAVLKYIRVPRTLLA
ncbi:MAG: iron ABC transporter permease, partial [Tannerellaceae bacterium]